ncbi:serine/threonine-protein kinase [Mycobacterium sp. SMC-19]|uniref:serine/threonine-protein kinase n=1 Tax=Mycobacterium sp. SMC-19 TaxID=3381630 RepID=UPI00387658AD
MSLHSGDVFAGYRILRLLGSGGMGEVYLAQHPRLPRHDALKILPSQVSADEEFRRRFEREADLASALWHPHIVGVHDRGETDGQLWISMDYVDGRDAAQLLAESYPAGMPISEVAEIVTAVASALDYAHRQGLVHRDVKPANIMLTRPGGDSEQRILLTDFGIARNISDISGLTATNMTVGTVAYAAPEQLMGEDLDGRADQYALAATAYHLATGTQLFPHTNPAVVISRHLNATPPALADHRPELGGIDPIFAVALAKTPRDRFRLTANFARALAEQASSMGVSSPPVAVTKANASAKPTGVPRGKAQSGRANPASMSATTTPSKPTTGSFRPMSVVAHNPSPLGRRTISGARGRWLVSGSVLAVVVLASFVVLAWHPWAKSGMLASSSSKPATPLVSTEPAAAATWPMVPPPRTLTTTTPTAPAIIDVDPTEYESSEYPGLYRWVYARTPYYRDCGIFPLAMKSTEPEGLSCSVAFPAGTPEVSNPPFSGPPNEIQIRLPDGPTNAISEGGPQTAKALLPNHRITVGPFSCTALHGGGIDCEAPTGGFSFANEVLTARGPR